MGRTVNSVLVLSLLLLLPQAAYSQASIAGQVRDASGAVLPGVTVEASSPALIEKVRTVVTGGTGQYRIELLPPGEYTTTFTLPGFSTVQRAGIQLTGTFTATIDAEMRVGAVEETITVTGESPIVDVQTATRQRVIDRELIDGLPTGRSPFAQMALIPGVSVPAANQDVGGATQLSGAISMQVHGTTGASQLLQENGLSTAVLVSPGSSQFTFNMAASQEIAVDYAGASAENNAAGVRMNVIPREGGNTFNGTLFVNGATGALQGNNFSEELQAAGLRSPDEIKTLYDINPGFGGPLRQDRLWFYLSGRRALAARWAASEFYDKNFNNPNVWTYEPDLSRPVANESDMNDARLRLTLQATPKLKVGGLYVQQTARNWPTVRDTQGRATGATLTAYEASPYHYFPVERQVTFDVTSPLTSRLLFDGAYKHAVERAIRDPAPGLNPDMISVLEQSTGREYRARTRYINRPSYTHYYRAALSYITGAHSLKVGFGDITGYVVQRDWPTNPLSYRFNRGVPNLITMNALPVDFEVNVDHQWGVYVQDRWTVDQLTLNLGLRWDWFKNSYPAQTVGPVLLAPTRTFSYDKTEGLSLHDLNPKLSAAYDVFGNGRTALKASANRYVEQYTIGGIAGQRNPVNRLANTTTRSWNDANRDYVPDCDLLNLGANGECGAVANRNFGSTVPEVNLDEDLLEGWGKRHYNWEATAGVQHEITSGIAADFSYFRRWYGNFSVTDNRAVTAADFDRFSIAAPADPRLPGDGGYTVSDLYDVTPALFGRTDNFITFADNFGGQTRTWNGVALTLSARLPNGVTLQGGVDTGSLTLDTCALRAQLPEIDPTDPHCHTELPQTQFKFLGMYTIPRIDVQVSGTLQSLPGHEIHANFTATNAQIAPSLGRNLAGTATTKSINLVEPGTMYGPRLNQLDLRVGKMVRLGGTLRATFNLDVYNALNVDTALTLNNAYASWQRPQSIILARFAKIGMQLDF
jgi:hypothetical protein